MTLELIPETTYDYQLLDSGNGKRYERFGTQYLVRPDASCIWKAAQKSWHTVDAEFTDQWHSTKKHQWEIALGTHNGSPLRMELSLGNSKNIGFFPEMLAHWPWLANCLKHQAAQPPQILNLFAHTGSTTLFLASQGAQVTHVDASRPAINRARHNQEISGLAQAPIRWIVDDCLTFMHREVNRHKTYQGIIMDPPAFGRDHKKNFFLFEQQIHELLAVSATLLAPENSFFILNGYALGNSAHHLYNCVIQHLEGEIEKGELLLLDRTKRVLPCSLFVRVKK